MDSPLGPDDEYINCLELVGTPQVKMSLSNEPYHEKQLDAKVDKHMWI
jgi:hypothetical protein